MSDKDAVFDESDDLDGLIDRLEAEEREDERLLQQSDLYQQAPKRGDNAGHGEAHTGTSRKDVRPPGISDRSATDDAVETVDLADTRPYCGASSAREAVAPARNSGKSPLTEQARELRLRTIEAVCDLMRSSGTFAPDADAIVPHSNGYSMWFVAYDPQPISTKAIETEEILRRIEAREALAESRKTNE